MTTGRIYGIIFKRSAKSRIQHGGIAQLARATGSYPVGHGFKSNSRYQEVVRQIWRTTHIRPVGQAAKTPPFHGGNGSSILPRVTNKKNHLIRGGFSCWCLVAQATRHMQSICGVRIRRSKIGELARQAQSVRIFVPRNSPILTSTLTRDGFLYYFPFLKAYIPKIPHCNFRQYMI